MLIGFICNAVCSCPFLSIYTKVSNNAIMYLIIYEGASVVAMADRFVCMKCQTLKLFDVNTCSFSIVITSLRCFFVIHLFGFPSKSLLLFDIGRKESYFHFDKNGIL